MKLLLITFITCFTLFKALAAGADTLQIKNNDVKIYAIRLDQTINVDGELNEPIWEKTTPFENLIQRDPIEGVTPTERTVIKIAYDDDALYIGARMYDSSPDSIVARLSRRDEWVHADNFTLYLDPYYDKRSGYFFAVNAGGTLIDGVLYNDEWDDESWDGVWEGKVLVDDVGWCAEMKIPFSQMRFNKSELNIWGINFRRSIARKNEWDYLVYIPKTESGFVSHFADLVGMDDLSPQAQIEFLPYVTTRAEYIKSENGDPFNDGSNYIPGAGWI